jgi:hypothetical protein
MKARLARAARSMTLALALPAALFGAGSWSTSADALTIKLPLLGSATETAKPIEVSLPPITISLPGVVTVSTPQVGVSVQAPVVSTPVVTVPGAPSQPVQAPKSTETGSSPTEASGSLSPTSTRTGAVTATTAATSPAPSSAPGSTAATVSDGSTVTAADSTGKARSAIVTGKRKQGRPTLHRSGTSTALSPAPALGQSDAVEPAKRTIPKHATSSPLASLGREIPLPIPVPDWSKPIILALLLLAGFFALRSRLAARRAGRLEGQRETLLRDLDVVQVALVPDVPAHLGGLGVSVAYRPADGPAAGGDFYDVFLLEPGKVVMILGDVSGHGHDAVSHAALTRYTLRAYMQAGLEPRAALALAGQVMADPGCGRFATVAVGVYREQEGTFTYASAGHPAPIILGRPVPSASEACCSPPIGWSAPTGRRQSTVSLPAGAAVCFFTDGLPEARASSDLLLGRERVQELLVALGPRPQAGELLEQVRATALSTPDDMAACVLRAQSSGSALPIHTEELEVDLRRLQGDAVARFMADSLVPSQVAERVLAQAQTIARKRGTALIRVTFGERASSATVVTAGPRATVDLARELQSRPLGARPVPAVPASI